MHYIWRKSYSIDSLSSPVKKGVRCSLEQTPCQITKKSRQHRLNQSREPCARECRLEIKGNRPVTYLIIIYSYKILQTKQKIKYLKYTLYHTVKYQNIYFNEQGTLSVGTNPRRLFLLRNRSLWHRFVSNMWEVRVQCKCYYLLNRFSFKFIYSANWS